MSVWLCIPSKRPPEEAEQVFRVWRERGYKIALWRDEYESAFDSYIQVIGAYPGYARAVNDLALRCLRAQPDCDWIVAAGDDTLPDPNKSADEIARECSEHFLDRAWPKCWHWPAGKTLEEAIADGSAHQEKQRLWSAANADTYRTFGVMQPTGDRDFGDAQGPYIDRVAGSPWLGREFCLRINQGNGPLWPGYFHMGVDEELQALAIKCGVFWQRPDLTHFHQHWGRPRPGERMGQASRRPAFLDRANSAKEWIAYKKLLKERQEAGFPGSEPL